MPTYSFDPLDPTLGAPKNMVNTNPDHVSKVMAYENAMNSPAYWDQSHRDHFRTRRAVEHLARELYGSDPVSGFNGGGITLDPAGKEVPPERLFSADYGKPTVFDPDALPDDQNKAD